MAVLKFRVYWEEDDSVYRDVVVKHTQSFKELHDVILKCFDFDNKHYATFYKSNDNWQRGREITLEKYDKAYKAEPLIMSESLLGSEIREPNQKFIYVYDFHTAVLADGYGEEGEATEDNEGDEDVEESSTEEI